MPYLRIQTNQPVENPVELLKKLSAEAAAAIGKPEAYIMTACDPTTEMTFAGTDEPTAFLQCKSIGLGSDKTKAISAALCGFCEKELGVPQDRVYIEFVGAEGSMWGWKGSTF